VIAFTGLYVWVRITANAVSVPSETLHMFLSVITTPAARIRKPTVWVSSSVEDFESAWFQMTLRFRFRNRSVSSAKASSSTS
jgi:hypothetical protein